MKRSHERLAGLSVVALADDPAFGYIASGEVDQLSFLNTQDPYVAARRNDDALHKSEPTAEVDALRWRQGLAVLVEYSDGLATIAGEPGIVMGVDRRAECTAFHSAAGEARGYRR